MKDYGYLAPIYASLTRSIAADLVRLKGYTPEQAEKEALEFTLQQAQALVVGLDDVDEQLDRMFPDMKYRKKNDQE